MSACADVTVYFDGSCSLCRHEIAFYRRRRPLTTVRFEDLSQISESAVAADLSWSDAMSVLHVRGTDGLLRRGVEAFLLLWSCYPGLRLLSHMGALPVFRSMLNLGYRMFLRWRASRPAGTGADPCRGGEQCSPARMPRNNGNITDA